MEQQQETVQALYEHAEAAFKLCRRLCHETGYEYVADICDDAFDFATTVELMRDALMEEPVPYVPHTLGPDDFDAQKASDEMVAFFSSIPGVEVITRD